VGLASRDNVCNIIGWEEPEITKDPVIKAEPENGKPTPETNTVTPVEPERLLVEAVAEPLILINGTFSYINVPFWYISSESPPEPPVPLVWNTPIGTWSRNLTLAIYLI